MAGRLVPVAEESADVSTAAYPPRSLYRHLFRRVAVSGAPIRAAIFSHSPSGHSGSNYSSDSGTSNSFPSHSSGCSSCSASAAAADFGTHELETIACRMVSDGYIQRMVQAFNSACPALVYSNHQERILERWFFELDVDWVLQTRQEHDSQWQLPLQDNSGSSLQDFVERWIRGFTVIVHSILELDSAGHDRAQPVWFSEASISKMLIFVDAIVPAFKAENLRAVLDMYICAWRERDNIKNSKETNRVWYFFDDSMVFALTVYVEMLKGAVSSTMQKVRSWIEEDDSWDIEIPRGGGEVHRNTRWIADCVVSLFEAEASSIFDRFGLSDVRDDTIHFLKDLLLRKSELCSDPSLRYLFLLNNSYFAAQMIEPCQPGHDWKLKFGCDKYMHSFLDVSWGHVLSCIPKSHSPGPFLRWINTPSLAKFESVFNKTYQVQKFWKVPDPGLRYVLRRAITDKVVSSYRDYLKDHPELAEHVSRRNSTPEVLEEMLGQLFEG